MRLHYILHANFEMPGILEVWARDRGFSQTYSRPFMGESLPSVDAVDWLVVMGGPQSPLAIERAPYLKDEIVLIDRCVRKERPILGFCLGAQLIGEALGAHTERSPHKEVGIFPIELTHEGRAEVVLRGMPSSLPVVHWHNDMPGLTPEAKVLALSSGCPRQIVRYTPRIYGFQCHLELMKENVEMMVRHCSQDLVAGTYVQTADELLSASPDSMNGAMQCVLDNFYTVIRFP